MKIFLLFCLAVLVHGYPGLVDISTNEITSIVLSDHNANIHNNSLFINATTCAIRLPNTTMSKTSSSSSTGSSIIWARSSSSSSSNSNHNLVSSSIPSPLPNIITNIQNLTAYYVTSNNVLLQWLYVNGTKNNVTITMNGIALTNQSISLRFPEYRVYNLQPATMYLFVVNNVTLNVTTLSNLDPVNNFGYGQLFTPNHLFNGTFDRYDDEGLYMSAQEGPGPIIFQGTNECGTNFSSLFFYAVIGTSFNLQVQMSSTLIDLNQFTSNGILGIVYVSDFHQNQSSSIVWAFQSYEPAGTYDTFFSCIVSQQYGLQTYYEFQNPFEIYMQLELNQNVLTYTFTQPSCCAPFVSTYQVNAPQVGYVGLILSGEDVDITWINLGLSTGPATTVSGYSLSATIPGFFNGYNPSNLYNQRYVLSWNYSSTATEYIVSIVSINGVNASTVLSPSNQKQNNLLLGTLSSLYNYTLSIVSSNTYGLSAPLLLNIPSTAATTTTIARPVHVNNSVCGTLGIDYDAYNSFGTYVWQVPVTNCNQQWVQVYGANGGGTGNYISLITNLIPGTLYTIVVGESGFYAPETNSVYGQGCAAGQSGASAGGGYTGIFPYNNISLASSIVVAGGGGGTMNGHTPGNNATWLPIKFNLYNYATTCPAGGSNGGSFLYTTNAFDGGLGYVNPSNSHLIQSIIDIDTNPTNHRCIDPSLAGVDGAVLLSCLSNSPSTTTQTQLNNLINPTGYKLTTQPTTCQLHSMNVTHPGTYLSDTCIVPSQSTRSDNWNYVCPSNKTYYVNIAQGLDSNNGLSPSMAFHSLGPIQTLGQNSVLKPGDTILLCNGDHHFNWIYYSLQSNNPYDASLVGTNCSLKFSSYVCNDLYADQLPGWYSAQVLPQITNSNVGWQLVPHQLLNGTVINVYAYNLRNVDAANGGSSSYFQIIYQQGIGALWVEGVRYTWAQHPNIKITGNNTVYGIFGESFNQMLGTDVGSDVSYVDRYDNHTWSAGSWCHHIWHDLFGENQTSYDTFFAPGTGEAFRHAYVSEVNFFFSFGAGSPMDGPVLPGTIDCAAWYAKYVGGTFGPHALPYNATNGYVLDAIILTPQDVANVTNWMLPVLQTNTLYYTPARYGSGNGFPIGDNTGRPPGAPPPLDGVTQFPGSGGWYYGKSFQLYNLNKIQEQQNIGMCYFLDAPGEFCMDKNFVIYLIPLNAEHEQALLRTQSGLTFPLDPWYVGFNQSAVSTYIMPDTYGPSVQIISNGNNQCPIWVPNYEFSNLEFAYSGSGISLVAWNAAVHHCVFHDLIGGGVALNNAEELYETYTGYCYFPTVPTIVNPWIPGGLSNFVVHNNIFYNLGGEMIYVGGTGIQLALNNTMFYGPANYAIDYGLGKYTYVRGNYVYNTGCALNNNWFWSENYTLLSEQYGNYVNQRVEYNHFNLTNTAAGDYSTITPANQILNGNVVNNTMCGYWFALMEDIDTSAFYFMILWTSVTNNIFDTMICGTGGIQINLAFEYIYPSEGIKCLPDVTLNITNNLFIDDWVQGYIGIAQPPWGVCGPPNVTINNNSWIYLNVQPGQHQVVATITPYLQAPGENPGTNWITAVSSLNINPLLYYSNQSDMTTGYPFRQTNVENYMVPPLVYDPTFTPYMFGYQNTMDYNAAVTYHNTLLNSLTYVISPTNYPEYLAGNTLDPLFIYGQERVYNYTKQSIYDLQLQNCQDQAATEDFYTRLVVNFFPYYQTPSCWLPQKVITEYF